MKRIWFKLLKKKASDKESDNVAWMSTVLVLQVLITNIFIIDSTISHWNS